MKEDEIRPVTEQKEMLINMKLWESPSSNLLDTSEHYITEKNTTSTTFSIQLVIYLPPLISFLHM